MCRTATFEADYDELLEFINLALGYFDPVRKFMNYKDFISVVQTMTTHDGSLFSLPILLSSKNLSKSELIKCKKLKFSYNKQTIGTIEIEDIFQADKRHFYEIFGTNDHNHPGLKKQFSKPLQFIGGRVNILDNQISKMFNIIDPVKIKKHFMKHNWKSVVGFQTRNPIHKAHEFLQRIGLEVCDGLLINPLVGWKKEGDFTEEAISNSYEVMIRDFYPQNRVFFCPLRTSMRYAGPREAIFHALIRKNLGCSHFIIGRDHAGVGSYYKPYDAHVLAKKLSESFDMGIELMLFKEPYYCKKCLQIVTESSCNHQNDDIVKISGTKIREMFKKNKTPNVNMVREEISISILKSKSIFVEGF